MLQEKLTLLIKGLPKTLRRSFVPAPQFAEAAISAMSNGQGALLPAFSKELERMTGIYVPLEQWALEKLPKYLLMNFRVLDQRKKKIAESGDLHVLQQKFTGQSVQAVVHHSLERQGIKAWEFDDLPEMIVEKSQGLNLQLFPALVDMQDSVAIQVFDSRDKADAAMVKGVRRLLMLVMYQQVKMLDQEMKKMKQMMMFAALMGKAETLRKDVIEKIFEAVFLSDISLGQLPRSKEAFEQCLQRNRARLIQEGQRIINMVDAALQAHTRLTAAICASVAPQKATMLEDVKQQCASLIYDGFVAATPITWLRHMPRFLDAACIRVEKSARDLNKDKQMAEQVNVFWQQYQQRCKLLQGKHATDNDLNKFRWMIEELRVSLFAQELKTSMPISVKRLEKRWQALR
jgi:ATP-dependent helicase HrpA